MLFVSIRDLAAHAVSALLCTMRGRVHGETCGARLDQLARMVRYSAVSLWNLSSQTNACRQLRARKNRVFLMSMSFCCIYSRCVECVFFHNRFTPFKGSCIKIRRVRMMRPPVSSLPAARRRQNYTEARQGEETQFRNVTAQTASARNDGLGDAALR